MEPVEVDGIHYEVKENAFRGNLKSYSINPHDSESLLTYLNDISDVIREILVRELNQLISEFVYRCPVCHQQEKNE